MTKDIIIQRTGKVFSIASSEFEVTYPDGVVGKIWSPPWHEMSPKEEEIAGKNYAEELYRNGMHT